MWDTSKQPPPSQPPTYPQMQPQMNPQMQPQMNPQMQPQPAIQVQVYNIPASAVPQYPAVQPVQQNEGWLRRNQKNKPQSNSVGTASLIFISGGMNMAWNLGLGGAFITNYTLPQHLILSWFIGGIIGVVVGAIACNRVPKKLLMGFASIMVTIGGILQVSDPNSYDSILASRYLNGIAVGLVFPMTFVLVGEEVVKNIRGMNAASVDTMCFSCGIFIQILYSVTWTAGIEDSFQSIQMCGVLNIIYGVIAFLMGSMLLIESPIFYLARGDEQMAIDSLRRLQRPFTITYETYEQLEEHKRYLAESKERSFLQNAIYGLPALLKLCFYRAFMALGFSYFVNFAFTYSSIATTQLQTYPFILYAFARWLGPLIVTFTMDSRGRKNPMIIGFLICTILAFTVGGIFNNKLNYIDADSMNAVKYILIFFQLFASISMTSCSVYLSEAFPLAVKPYYVAIVFIVEMLVQIICITSISSFIQVFSHISDYFLTLGALLLVFLGVAIYVMPETKMYSLRECLPKFKKFNNFLYKHLSLKKDYEVYNIPTSLPPTVQTTNDNWWKLNRKNRPQANSVRTVSFIFISGGINMAWKLGLSATSNTGFWITERMISCWFEGALIGAIGGAYFVKYFPKKFLMWMSSVLVFISGILQLADPNSYNTIMASRYLNGLAVGFIFPLAFVLIGEELIKPLRGLHACSVDTISFSFGIFIQIIYPKLFSNNPEAPFSATQMYGLLNMICGIIAFILTTMYLIESPIFYLVREDERMALDSLIALQKPHELTSETYEQLEEHKRYLAESKEKTFKENAIYGIPALLKLCFYRSFMALGFSYLVNFAFAYSSLVTIELNSYSYIFYAFAKLLGPLIASFTLDSIGRKPTMIIGFFGSSILAFVVGVIFKNELNYTIIERMNSVKYVLIFFQLFSSLSMASSSAYLSEAFPLPVKRHYLTIVFIVEMLVHIIIGSNKQLFIVSNIFLISDYFLTLGSLSLEEDNTTWLKQLWQCRLQFELMMPAALVFLAGGLKTCWSVYELPSAEYDLDFNPNFLTIAWFIGVIVGVFAASLFVGRVTKNISHILSGSLLIVGSILFILMPTTYIAIAFSCICEGIAFGLIQLQAFVSGAEVASKDIRGLVMSTERCFIWFGILLQLTLTYIWYTFEPPTGHTMHVDQIHGIVVSCLGVTVILWTFKLRAESPLLLLQQRRDVAAAVVLQKLQGTHVSNNEVMRLREDCLQLLSMDVDDSCWFIFRNYNLLPLIKVFILRCFVTITMSQPFNHIFLSASWLGFDCDMNCLYTLTMAGLLGSLLGGLVIDHYGRRRLCVVTLLPATIFMFIAGGIMDYLTQAQVAVVPTDLEIVSILILLYQFIICTAVYLSEAFTVTQKPKCIAVVLIGENLLQILLSVISFKTAVSATALYFVMGVMCLQLGLYVFLCMPETKNLTLYECLQKFRGISLSK
ncbi:facilitated glucose transporter member 2, Solute carrier family 2 [Lucilia cuprina]|nr:facilitated glucose transporter member 2, Solute carrier family 2 [Lucilia cuprina]